jgi:hypothetical protein
MLLVHFTLSHLGVKKKTLTRAQENMYHKYTCIIIKCEYHNEWQALLRCECHDNDRHPRLYIYIYIYIYSSYNPDNIIVYPINSRVISSAYK